MFDIKYLLQENDWCSWIEMLDCIFPTYPLMTILYISSILYWYSSTKWYYSEEAPIYSGHHIPFISFVKRNWSYCHVIHIINKLPIPFFFFFQNQTSYQVLHHYHLIQTFFKVFSYLCFVYTLRVNRFFLDYRSKKYIYLGFKTCGNGHTHFDLHSK